MKASKILRHAAIYADQHGERGRHCIMQIQSPQKANELAQLYYAHYMLPLDDMAYVGELRVLMLLFAACIAESEGD